MKIIDERELFEVDFNHETTTVLALTLKDAVNEVLSWHSIDEDDEYINCKKMDDEDVIKETVFDNEEGSTMKLTDYIKKEIKEGTKAVILTYTEQ